MAVQANAAVWNALVADLKEWMDDAGYGIAVYLREAPGQDVTAQYAIQVIPGGDTARHPISGVGLLESQVQLVVWWRNLYDPVHKATLRIAGERGIEQFIDGLRTRMIQNTLGGRLTIPFTWRSGGNVEQVDDLVGWMRGTETFVCAFEIEWSVQ
jgi:hypothetical protein